MYTPSQTADMLQIATSTLRKYANLYRDHLSEAARRKHRRYTDSDIAVLKRIVDLRSEGIALDDISGNLGVVESPHPSDSLAMIPAINAEFQTLRDVLVGMQAQIDDLAQDLEEERNKSLWDRLRGR